MWAASSLAKRDYWGGIIPNYPSISIKHLCCHQGQKMLGPDGFPSIHCQVGSWEQMPWDGQWPVVFSSWNIVNWSMGELECSIPWLPVLLLCSHGPLCIPHHSHCCSPLTHPPSAFGTPLLYLVDGWALHCWAFVPFLAHYPGILLFPPHPGAFRSRISKHLSLPYQLGLGSHFHK